MHPFAHTGRGKVSENLDAALKLPRASRQVTEFLFSNVLESNFHPAHAIPPTLFAHSLALDFTIVTSLRRGPLDPPRPAHATLPPEALAVAPRGPQHTVQDEKHALFVPIAAHPPYSFGYTLVHNTGESAWPAIDVFPTTFVARYALHTRTQDLVCVSYMGAHDFLAVRATTVAANGARTMIMLSTPALEYTWDRLPTTALWSVMTSQYRGIDPGGDAPAPTVVPRTYEEVCAEIGIMHAPTTLAALHVRDSASPSLPADVHGPALAALADAHVGVFYSPMVQIDFALGPAAVTSCSTMTQAVMGGAGAKRMQRMLSDLYYGAVLSVCADGAIRGDEREFRSSDTTLLTWSSQHSDMDTGAVDGVSTITRVPDEGELIDLGMETENCTTPCSDDMVTSLPDVAHLSEPASWSPASLVETRQAAGALVRRLANGAIRKEARPRSIQPRPAGMAVAVATTVPTRARTRTRAVTAEELAKRAERRQARRERNRVAAARSNERRRLKHVGLKTEIASERERARVLLERLRLATAENAQLRQKLGAGSRAS